MASYLTEEQIKPRIAACLDAAMLTYGVLDFNTVIHLLTPFFSIKNNQEQTLNGLFAALPYSRYTKRVDFIFSHRQLKNPHVLYKTIIKKQDLHYVSLSEDVVIDVSKGYFPVFSVHHNALSKVLNNDFNIDTIQLYYIMHQILVMLNLDWSFQAIVSQLNLKNVVAEREQRLLKTLSLVYQHTPRWLNKGRVPHSDYVPKEDTKPVV